MRNSLKCQCGEPFRITKQTITSVRRAHSMHRIARKAITTDGQDVMFLYKAVHQSIRHFMTLFWLKYLWYKIPACVFGGS